MKIRVLHLPRDLHTTPKQTQELAAELGIPLKPSVFAALTPRQRDRSVQRYAQRRNGGRG